MIRRCCLPVPNKKGVAMRQALILLAVVCSVAVLSANQPIRELQGPSGDGGSGSSLAVEEYLTLNESAADCVGDVTGLLYFYHQFPAGGPWSRVTFGTNRFGLQPQIWWGANELLGEPQAADQNCVPWARLDAPCSTPCSAAGAVYAPVGNRLLFGLPAEDLPRHVYFRWER